MVLLLVGHHMLQKTVVHLYFQLLHLLVVVLVVQDFLPLAIHLTEEMEVQVAEVEVVHTLEMLAQVTLLLFLHLKEVMGAQEKMFLMVMVLVAEEVVLEELALMLLQQMVELAVLVHMFQIHF